MNPESYRRRRRWIAIGLVAIVLAAVAGIASSYLRGERQRASATAMPTPDAHVLTPAEALRALPAPEQAALAHRAAFGTDGTATVDGEGGAMRYQPGEVVWLGDTAALLSPGTNAEDCHACSGAVAITYLEPRGRGFAVKGKWMDMIHGNGFGQPPSEWAIRTDMAAAPVVVAETGFTNQGYSCGVTTLTLLTPAGPVQSEPVPTSYSNEGAVDPDSGRTMGGERARALDGEIVEVRQGAGFTVRAGTVTDRYVVQGDRFVREGGASPLACE